MSDCIIEPNKSGVYLVVLRWSGDGTLRTAYWRYDIKTGWNLPQGWEVVTWTSTKNTK
jgi:hypothetical protein